MGSQITRCDILIRGGTVYDGVDTRGRIADVAIADHTIAAIGESLAIPAGVTIDASGLAVSPGFIDIHTHSDFSLLHNPPMYSTLAQGVTTEVVGNCGTSMILARDDDTFGLEKRWIERQGGKIDWNTPQEYLLKVENSGIGANVATLAGHGTLRKDVLGMSSDAPTDEQLARMQALLARALDAGAIGISTGLEYQPGGYAKHDEQAALVRVAGDAGAIYTTHVRNEGDTLVESIREALDVAVAAGARLQLSHHKVEGRSNWGKIKTTLAMMEQARRDGHQVMTDQYPYTAYMTGLSVIVLPEWAKEGTFEEMAARLRDAETRSRVLAHMNGLDIDWRALQVGISRQRPETQGISFAKLAEMEGTTPQEAALDLLIADDGWVAAVHFAMSEEDVETVLRDTHTMIGSDGVSQNPAEATAKDNTHPRSYGTFPRVLGMYVRNKHVISLGEAIRRMTSLPAGQFKFDDRGRLAVGAKADVVVFDPTVIEDKATFVDPYQYPDGFRQVLVNGRFAMRDGELTGALAGRVLRRR